MCDLLLKPVRMADGSMGALGASGREGGAGGGSGRTQMITRTLHTHTHTHTQGSVQAKLRHQSVHSWAQSAGLRHDIETQRNICYVGMHVGMTRRMFVGLWHIFKAQRNMSYVVMHVGKNLTNLSLAL